jgi:hypothetical protein
MHSVLLNLNIFESQIGIFKQHSGLAMGSFLYPSLANIFLDILEKSAIPKFKNKKKSNTGRYADDVLCISLYEEDRYFLVWSSTLVLLNVHNVLDQTRKYLSSL